MSKKLSLSFILILFAINFLFAKQKMAVITTQTTAVSQELAELASHKMENVIKEKDLYKITSPKTIKKFYDIAWSSTFAENTDYDYAKIGNKLGAKFITVLTITSEDNNGIDIEARLINTKTKMAQKIYRTHTYKNVQDFVKKELENFTTLFLASKKMPKGELTIKTNSNIDVFVNKQKISKEDYTSTLLPVGFYKITVLYREGKVARIVDKRTIEIKRGETFVFNHTYSDKNTILAKSALLPGLGQMTSDRPVVGALYCGAFIGAGVYLGMSYADYSDKKSDYDKQVKVYDKANDVNSQSHNYSDLLKLKKKLDNLHSDIEDAKTSMLIATGVMASIYIVNIIDAYMFAGDVVETTRESNKVSLTPYMNYNKGFYKAGFSINF